MGDLLQSSMNLRSTGFEKIKLFFKTGFFDRHLIPIEVSSGLRIGAGHGANSGKFGGRTTSHNDI